MDIRRIIKDLKKEKVNSEVEDRLKDVQIRMHDVQDRVYDMRFLLQQVLEQKGVNNNELILKDVQVRVNDVQDRIYDLLWQQKTKAYQRDLMFWQLYKYTNESELDAKLRFFHSLPCANGMERKNQKILTELLHKICNLCEEKDISYWLDFGTLLGAIRHGGFIPWDDDIDISMLRSDVEKLENILKDDSRFIYRYVFLNYNGNGITRVFQVRFADVEFGQTISSLDIFIYDYCTAPQNGDWTFFMKSREEFAKKSKTLVKTSVPFKLNHNIQEILQEEYKKAVKPVEDRMHITKTSNSHIVFGFDNFYYKNYCDEHIFESNVIFPLKKLNFEGYSLNVPNQYMLYISGMYEDIFSLPSDMLSHKHVDISDKDRKVIDFLYQKYCLEEGK